MGDNLETVETEVKAEPNAEIEKYKALLSKANSEAASFKRQLREKQSAEEQEKAEALERQTAMEQELAELKQAKAISDYTSKFVGVGFGGDIASECAKAMVGGDMDTVFANFKTLTDSIRKSAVADAMDNQKGLSVGETPKGYSRTDISSMTVEEINANWGKIKGNLK